MGFQKHPGEQLRQAVIVINIVFDNLKDNHSII